MKSDTLRSRHLLHLLATLPLAFSAWTFSNTASADQDIKWNGYLNVVGGAFMHDPRNDDSGRKQRPGIINYSRDISFDSQSSAAIQAEKFLDHENAVTLQLFADGVQDNYAAKLKWMYLTHKINDHGTLRIGRVGTPFYYYSDSYNVGYSYHWTALPYELYHYDTVGQGIDYIYRDSNDNFDWSAEFAFGAGDQNIPDLKNAYFKARNTALGIFSMSTGGWLTLRLMTSQVQGDFNMDEALNPVPELALDTAKTMGLVNEARYPALKPMIRQDMDAILDLQDVRFRYHDVSLMVEQRQWFAMMEAWRIDLDNYALSNHVDAWMVSLGRRMGKALYHVTVAEVVNAMNDNAITDASLGLPPGTGDQEIASFLAHRAASQVAQAVARNEHSTTVGVRIDTTRNTAVKFDVMFWEDNANIPGEISGTGHNTLIRAALNASF